MPICTSHTPSSLTVLSNASMRACPASLFSLRIDASTLAA